MSCFLQVGHGLQLNWSQQAGGDERGILRVVSAGRESITAGRARFPGLEPIGPLEQRFKILPVAVQRQLLVADQAVDPEVDDRNLQLVLSGARRAGNVHAIGRLPGDAAILAVQPHPRHHLHRAQVEQDFGFGILDFGLEGRAVGRRPGVVMDTWVGVLAPVGQLCEGDRLFGAAPFRIERDLPRASHRGRVAQRAEIGPHHGVSSSSGLLLRNTTNQLCIGSKRSGTVILPSRSANSGSSRIAPVSGSHSSGRCRPPGTCRSCRAGGFPGGRRSRCPPRRPGGGCSAGPRLRNPAAVRPAAKISAGVLPDTTR